MKEKAARFLVFQFILMDSGFVRSQTTNQSIRFSEAHFFSNILQLLKTLTCSGQPLTQPRNPRPKTSSNFSSSLVNVLFPM
jgi:hypothetical protein